MVGVPICGDLPSLVSANSLHSRKSVLCTTAIT